MIHLEHFDLIKPFDLTESCSIAEGFGLVASNNFQFIKSLYILA